jgi:hypothetical protein
MKIGRGHGAADVLVIFPFLFCSLENVISSNIGTDKCSFSLQTSPGQQLTQEGQEA